jgi:hypothetical protein
MRRIAMQLTLAFLEACLPQKKPSIKLDPEARAESIKILARMIAAQSIEATKQTEADR